MATVNRFQHSLGKTPGKVTAARISSFSFPRRFTQRMLEPVYGTSCR